MLKKIFDKLDASPAFQNFITPTIREEKIARKIFVPAICAAIWLVFLASSAGAAEPDLTQFFEVDEASPILVRTQDSTGQPVNTIDQIDLLVRLPNENFARRVRVNLKNTLFLDPRAPAPGQRTYDAILELDGTVTKLPASNP